MQTPNFVMKLPNLQTLTIVKYPSPVLKRRSEPVNTIGKSIGSLALRMLGLMHEAKGVGLAAPQVGIPLRMFVCNPTGEEDHDLVCVNPQLLKLEGAEEKEEGCLSIPGVTVTMRRSTHVVMEAIDLEGKPFRVTGEDLTARVWQHEVDHLNGRLIIDAMSATDEIANRRALKQLEADYQSSRRRHA